MGEGYTSFQHCHSFGIDVVLVAIVAGLLMLVRALYDGLRK